MRTQLSNEEFEEAHRRLFGRSFERPTRVEPPDRDALDTAVQRLGLDRSTQNRREPAVKDPTEHDAVLEELFDRLTKPRSPYEPLEEITEAALEEAFDNLTGQSEPTIDDNEFEEAHEKLFGHRHEWDEA